jgi:hypothetical protein
MKKIRSGTGAAASGRRDTRMTLVNGGGPILLSTWRGGGK